MKRMSEQKAIEILKCYKSSNLYSLDNCYKDCSCAKWRAWKYCENIADKYDTTVPKIIGYNTMTYSVAMYRIEDNGDITVYFITAYNDYIGTIKNAVIL